MFQHRSIIDITAPSQSTFSVVKKQFGTEGGLRVVFVAGIRGDTPEGIRLAYRLSRFLEEHDSALQGQVDIFPCVNPLAAEQGTRLWPFFDVDLNRQFPGKASGHPPSQVARALVDDVSGADLVIELRGARPGFSELAQALIRKGDQYSSQIAEWANVQLVWERTPGLSASSTFAYQFPHAIVLEGGRGNQLTEEVGEALFDGCLHILSRLNVLPEDLLPFPWMAIEHPIVIQDTQLNRLRSNRSGLFLPSVQIANDVQKQQEIGVVIEPSTGTIREHILSPCAGKVVAIRKQPVVSAGVMVARIWEDDNG